MEFRIADTFTDSLARLTGEEQKAVKTTVFDLQVNPANPGMSFHKLDKAKDKNFWSVRVSRDIRIIVHKTEGSLLLCYVNHHDKAYDWAERRKLETHPKTGAAQLVEIRETVKEILVPTYIEAPKAEKPVKEKEPLFAHLDEKELLSYGVPTEWLKDVREANEDTLLVLSEHLPSEASEALLELATGGKPQTYHAFSTKVDPFNHPDAQRRFRVMTNVEELERALEFPWDKWTVFLHPQQKHYVECELKGPMRVSGSAGTGKTIVALHRAVHLARTYPDARVLLTTFTDVLAKALQTRLKRLLGNEPRLGERVEVHSINSIGKRLYKAHFGEPKIISTNEIRDLLKKASDEVGGHKFTLHFLLTEWEQVVDAWQLDTWESYRDVVRLGRKTRLPEPQRKILWSIFEKAQKHLSSKNLVTESGLFSKLAPLIAKAKNPPFDFTVVDESQDIGVAHVRFFAAMGAKEPSSLFFAGDLGQRIFQQPFSWKALGVDIRGRSKTLRVNYRTSHQIRTQADRLLDPEISDADENVESRGGTVSTFNGPPPLIRFSKNEKEEIKTISDWLSGEIKNGIQPHELGVFIRSSDQLGRAQAAVKEARIPFKVLDENVETTTGFLSISTMHLAKGLEFRAVAVIACDDEVIPLQKRIEAVSDESDLKEVYDTERQLLYVACTRARDKLLITSTVPASEFLDDLRSP